MPHVLVADDSPTIRKLLGAWLMRAGYEVSLAADGFAVVSLIQQLPQRLVIVLDHHMPHLTGVEVVQTMLAISRPQQDSYIFMTSGVPEDDALANISRRLQAPILIKPFAAPTFLSAVAAAQGQQEQVIHSTI